MSVINIFSGIFCNEAAVVRDVVDATGLRLITDDSVIADASELSGIKMSKLKQAFSSRTSVFNKFTNEKERSIAYLKLSLARMLDHENLMVSGYSGLLIPQTISHVLRVCLIADTPFRMARADKEQQLSPEEAARVIELEDHNRSAWTQTLFSIKDPWNAALFDIVLPMDKTDPDKGAALIKATLLNEAVRKTDDSRAAANDFLLAAKTEVTLLNAGHNVGVKARNGKVVLTINKKVLMLNRLEDELKTIAGNVPGIISVSTSLGQACHDSHIYRQHNAKVPSKVLLVDDEREFVQTLSERLQMREMGSAVVFDGKSALDVVHNDEPEVMIIDLKMPGIDGMEVLRKVKLTQPEIEVIVLTGHGSELDKKKCMDLGAFAYMQKPVDINVLSDALKKAHEKIKANG